ncbi:RNA-dependent RNA polymerase [Rhodococcus phage ReqiPoco6]|uniref:Structural protein n=1 Tax=Rhodococcus phage ReqiPoco6 TaxID=691964 RepID=D4P7X4_9CAUD|nr:RNA-dependent RNA polymerase [Rhodococcus phage ReqiPoco6]ADD81104.1 structural protein [Rhodococcus phage ReqiPoco6]
MLINEDDYLAHYGILRRSGRYPWGSGGTPEQNHRSFMGMVGALKAEGMSDADIAKGFGISTRDYLALKSIAVNEIKAANRSRAELLRATGMSHKAIAEEMGLAGESSVRALLAPGAAMRANQNQAVADLLKDQIKDGGYLDIGAGNELYVGMSRTQFDTVVAGLRNEGYVVHPVQVDQVGTNTKTLIKVLAPEGTEYKDIVTNPEAIKSIAVKLKDGEIEHVRPPEMLDSKRVKVVYDEDGGSQADGTMYIRPGVSDLDLGGAQYAQVRIAVDGTHYLKGMAVYKNDLPPGVDVVFNTNKTNTGNKLDALKKMNRLPELDADGKPVKDAKGDVVFSDKIDMSNPFGATIKPGGQRGVLNVVNEEGDWSKWSKNLPSQMLSKQQPTIAKEQLDRLFNDKNSELNEIMALTNPAVKKKLLQSYADGVDADAVHLQAAHMPRQATQVILPIPVDKMRDTEIYAPNFRDGERVALVRFPHGGTFEIPELTVNNRNPEARKLLGTNAKDAVGINARVAERLSGADFDGDTVLVIPNDRGKIKSSPALEGLKDFNPQKRYPAYEGMKPMTAKQKQQEMGSVSNLIADMTIKGATNSELAAAVRHSMVVIDAEKHKLNYKQSAIDNNIVGLKKKYQARPDGSPGGAATLISRSTSEVRVNERKIGYKINPDTGEKIFTETGKGYTKTKVNPKTGVVTEKFIPRTQKSTKGAEAKDAHELSSGTRMEQIYADHSNRLKALGNSARKTLMATKSTPYSDSARKVYASEVKALDAKLNIALKNAPRERQAQLIANATIKQKRDANPGMEHDELKKVKAKALVTARARTGASKELINITDSEWEAIQAGAVSTSKLTKILDNTNLDRVKELATPRKNTVMTDLKQQRARQLLASGRTQSEVADILGVPLSTLSSSLQ